jgi:hypothetical protein
MDDAHKIIVPNYFWPIRRLCIVIYALGVVGSVMLFLLASIPPFNQSFSTTINPLPISILYLIIAFVGLFAVVWLLRLGNFGRWLILICAGFNALSFIYRTLIDLHSIVEGYGTFLVGLIFLCVDLFVLYYFMRQDVGEYVKCAHNKIVNRTWQNGAPRRLP